MKGIKVVVPIAEVTAFLQGHLRVVLPKDVKVDNLSVQYDSSNKVRAIVYTLTSDEFVEVGHEWEAPKYLLEDLEVQQVIDVS